MNLTRRLFQITSKTDIFITIFRCYLYQDAFKRFSKNFYDISVVSPESIAELVWSSLKLDDDDGKKSELRREFQHEYVDDHGTLDRYEAYIRKDLMERCNHSKSKNSPALYGDVVQSFGYGKSRMFLEAGKRRLNTIYACFHHYLSGYPKTNSNLLIYLEKHNDVYSLMFFIAAIYKIASDNFQKIRETSLPRIGMLPLCQIAGPDERGAYFRDFWDQVIQFCEKASSCTERETLEFYRKQQKLFDIEARRENGLIKTKDDTWILSELVIVFDESKILLNQGDPSIFVNIRKAQKALQSKNVVLLFTDVMIPSDDGSAVEVLPPFCEILTFDSVLSPEEPKFELDFYYRLFCLGRPLWKTRFRKYQSNIRSILHYARVVMTPVIFYRNKTEEYMRLMSDVGLAIVSIRVGICNVTDPCLAYRLMYFFMGTGTFGNYIHA